MASKVSNIVESARQRRQETWTKVQQALADIEADMVANDGTYQENAGKVTMTELFRRTTCQEIITAPSWQRLSHG